MIFRNLFLTLALAAWLTGCNGQSTELPWTNTPLEDPATILPDSSIQDPKNPPLTEAPKHEPHYSTEVMLFNGTGVSVSDWQNTELIVKSLDLSYRLVNSSQLNAMSLEDIASFGVIVVPGGSGGTITSNLTPTTRLNVRRAVREYGVSYVGFCAGAWVAVGPEAETTQVAGYGLAVAKGSVLPYYYPNGNTSLIAAMTDVTFADGSVRSLVWWGGPSTPEWPGGVIARYSNGKPAISQAWAGHGFVVISGPHPEAPMSWRQTAGYDRDGLDYDIAIDMIEAALRKQPLPTY